MAILFGALLVGGSITAFSNFGGNNNSSSSSSNPENIQQLISNLTSPIIPGATAVGNENAPINIVEFGDYQCPFCARFNQETKADLISKYVDSGIVRFGFKDLVINDLPKDKLSTLAAEASYCAADQDKYWQYHDEVYRNSRGENTGWINNDSLRQFAKNIKIPNLITFSECLDSHKHSDIVKNNTDLASTLGIGSSPTFVLFNGTDLVAIPGAYPYEVFEKTISDLISN